MLNLGDPDATIERLLPVDILDDNKPNIPWFQSVNYVCVDELFVQVREYGLRVPLARAWRPTCFVA